MPLSSASLRQIVTAAYVGAEADVRPGQGVLLNGSFFFFFFSFFFQGAAELLQDSLPLHMLYPARHPMAPSSSALI